jgi:NAD(P)-dependent dehydrogenase (short-subunit alcohol dehydrogenase family)
LPAKVAIITGAGSGIGEASSRALASYGFATVLAGRNVERLKVLMARIAADGGTALAVECDVCRESSVVDLFAKAIDHYGRVDLLFNNAGVFGPIAPTEDVSLDAWTTTLTTNLTGTFLCTREAFRVMSKQQPRGGRIINNGSISAYVPRVKTMSYAASKHGVTGITRSAALDGRRYGIACGQIDIGNARTDLANEGDWTFEQPDGTVHAEPTIDIEVVADAVVYMATLPLDANVPFMTVMATTMPYLGVLPS